MAYMQCWLLAIFLLVNILIFIAFHIQSNIRDYIFQINTNFLSESNPKSVDTNLMAFHLSKRAKIQSTDGDYSFQINAIF
jgi:hypothetical protein